MEQKEFKYPRKLPVYLTESGKTNGLSWKQLFGKGNFLNKRRILFLAQVGVAAGFGLVWAQHGHDDFWGRVFKK